MKKNFLRMTMLVPALLLFVISGYTQQKAAERVQQAHQQQQVFQPVAPGAARNVPATLVQSLRQQVSSYSLFEWTAADADALSRNGSAAIELTLRQPGGEPITLELVEVNNFAPDFAAVTSEGERIKQPDAHFYQGIIKDNPGTLAAISIYNDEVAGFFATAEGNYVVGRLKNVIGKGNYNIVYKESSLARRNNFNCTTPDIELPVPAAAGTTNLTFRCVRMYFETEYDIYTALGSNATAVTNYVTGLFNQVKTLYNNDGISVALSQIMVWTTTDPFTGASTQTLLNQFRSTRTSFSGDVGQLLTTRNIGGGRAAATNGLCGSTANKLCVSGNLDAFFSNVPTYSWDVNVTTHEFGHLMGSPHTHACKWNGNNTAIDGCGPTYSAIYAEGSCPTGPIPSGGGTIMSYCHTLLSTGINFNNGFGPQPADKIRTTVEAASCLGNCIPCPEPTALSTSAITNTSVTVSWTAAAGAASYMLEYKASTVSGWTFVGAVNATSWNLTGLVPGTLYDWRIRTNCAYSNSPYASSQFTTTGTSPCGTPTMSYVNFSGSGSSAVANIYFNPVAGATNYNIWIQTPFSSTPYVYIYNVTSSGSYTIYSSMCCYSQGVYGFAVQANCPAGSGVVSDLYFNYKTYTGRTTDGEIVKADAAKQLPADLQPAEIADNKLAVSPVPAAGKVTLRYNSPVSGRAVITVTNQLGIQMPAGITTTVHAGSNSTVLDISKLQNGMYTVQLQLKGQVLSSRLLVAAQ